MLFKSNDFNTKIKNFTEQVDFNDMYMLFDITDEKFFSSELIYQNDILSRQKEFYNFIKNNKNLDTFTVYSDNIYLEYDKNLEAYSIYPDDKLIYMDMILVDQGFQEFFKLNLDSGRNFEAMDYSSTDKTIPVILGYDLKKTYKIGDTFSDYYDNDFEVIGFLKEDSYYFNLQSSNRILYLNNTIVQPVQTNKYNLVSQFDSIINRTYVNTEDSKYINEIFEKSKELNLYTYYSKSFELQLQYVYEDLKNQNSFIFVLFLLLSIFSTLSITINIFKWFNNIRYELAIHSMLGASKKCIKKRIIIQIGLLCIVANFINSLIYKFSGVAYISIIYTMVIIIICNVLITKHLNRDEINIFLRRE